MPSYEDLLARQRADVRDGLLAHVKRLRWSAERLADEREQRLRQLLSRAISDSPFHRKRLRGVDPDSFTLADLPSLPVLTKGVMMANFDDLVTDRELTLRAANDHIEREHAKDYLFDRFRVLVTGGTSGRRGVFVYGWDEWVTLVLSESRARLLQAPSPPPNRIASLFAKKPSHVTGALHAFYADQTADAIHHIPVYTPVEEIVAELNDAQPLLLTGYPSGIQLLVGEARAGRLRIKPEQVGTGGEALVPDLRLAVLDVWGIEITDTYGATEGVFAPLCEAGALHLPDDLVIVEPVDEDGHPVAPGERAAKIYMTNLYNLTQPLIRYEMADSMVLHTDRCACGSAHSRMSAVGSSPYEFFAYDNGSRVHALALLGPLWRDRHIAEHQIRQTPDGIDVSVRATGDTDLTKVRAELHEALVNAGLPDPRVTLWRADRLDRAWSGKLPRFVPLGTDAAGPRPEHDAEHADHGS
jgi:phenylacetate-coenzyme A ligase PaaK-like adenylate-forming protein